MEQYKEKLKKQNIVLTLCSTVLLLCSALALASEMGLVDIAPSFPEKHWMSMWRGFVGGASTGLFALTAFALIRNLFAMRDEKKLKKLYVKTHDERTIQLFHNARSAAMSVFLIAVIVTGYFNPTISITILVCVMVCSSLCMWFKLYYEKKY